MKSNKRIIILAIIAALSLFTAINALQARKPQIIELDFDSLNLVASGDIVVLNYIVRYENGTMIDTTYEDVAKENQIYNSSENYTPVSIQVGADYLIKGLNEALIGMKAGEEKVVEIPAEKAYGPRDPNLTDVVSRLQISPRIQNSTRENFIDATGAEPEVGLRLQPPDLKWEILVLNVTPDLVTFMHDPSPDVKLSTAFGEADVRVTENEVHIILPKIPDGSVVSADYGTGIVTHTNDSFIAIDFNHPLAGETLVYTIKILSINSTLQDFWSDNATVTLKYFWSAYCGYCKKQDPILYEFLQEHPTINFVLIDVDEVKNKLEMLRYNAFGTPTFILEKGNVVLKTGGLQTKDQLTAFICPKLQDETCLTGEAKETGNITRWW